MKTTKQERLQHANDLIKVIASHGRRFFFHGGVNVYDPNMRTTVFFPASRYARLELRNGRVWFIDDYTEKAIFTHKTGFSSNWRGFSHGGTLRSLVESMREYIVHGAKIPRWRIATEQLYGDGDIWGYGKVASESVRAASFALAIMESSPVLTS